MRKNSYRYIEFFSGEDNPLRHKLINKPDGKDYEPQINNSDDRRTNNILSLQ